jgi:UDP-N-acetylmuramate dehydrogenase
MQAFVNFCTNHNLSGAQEFAGLPGTIGGAVYMNARCFDKSISDILYQTEQIEIVSKINTKVTTTNFAPSQWDYKKSPFQPNQESDNSQEPTIPKYNFSEHKVFVSSATFKLTRKSLEEKSQIQEECKKYINERKNKGHFNFPSAGSVFKNNHAFGAPSGKIIQDAELLGYTIGGAQVATFHGNIIINKENATATQIKELVQHVQKVVKEKFGFSLEPEIIFL